MNGQKPTHTEQLNCEQALQSNVSSPAIPIAEPLPGNWPQGAQVFPASYTQLASGSYSNCNPDLTAYHLPALWQLSGDLDLSALELHLGCSDRTPSDPAQLLRPRGQRGGADSPSTGALPPDRRTIGDRDPEAVIEAWFKQESSIPFDLTLACCCVLASLPSIQKSICC